MKKIIALSLISLIALLNSNAATWTNADGTGNNDSSIPLNWVEYTGNPSDTIIMGRSGDEDALFDGTLILTKGGAEYNLNQLIINFGVSAYIMSDMGETLVLGVGGLVNNGIGLAIESGIKIVSDQTWDLSTGQFDFKGKLEINADITINLSAGGTVKFSAGGDNPDWSGMINFVGDFTPGSITVTGTSFDKYSLWDKITFNGKAVELNGTVLEAIPEPSTYAAIIGLLAFAGILVARRRKA